ncbi:pentapeptide repeat-containing protein [Nostoc piscinale CENA21]|uniref:Pentapeptide repeat-containing protein n=1 Tax=Nostoc piscinale CENA21 TaxID=224013 RepID=A0A0M4SW24_9NOSO|nr:pentapeptide repeat-containing protein [Nostoc piscinale]ALF52834.1 pentapeptide repeat-containing protein [Nostoc piscinale CENA21]
MKNWRILASVVLAMVLFLFPLSAEAASSSSITRSAGDEVIAKDYSGQSLMGREFTNVDLENANFSNADLRGGVFNGTVLEGVNLHGVDFSEGIAYLARFKNADLTDAILTDAMMLRSTFDNVEITGADFTNAVLDGPQVKKLCVKASGVNSRTGVDTRESLGCK